MPPPPLPPWAARTQLACVTQPFALSHPEPNPASECFGAGSARQLCWCRTAESRLTAAWAAQEPRLCSGNNPFSFFLVKISYNCSLMDWIRDSAWRSKECLKDLQKRKKLDNNWRGNIHNVRFGKNNVGHHRELMVGISVFPDDLQYIIFIIMD